MKKEPLFIHSLFRSGSTYIYNAFRRETEGYFCYQEPLNEALLEGIDNKAALNLKEGLDKKTSEMRHPKLKAPYFHEFFLSHDNWHDQLTPELIYLDFFGKTHVKELTGYFNGLIDFVPKGKTPVLQCCRTILRSELIKSEIGGNHIFLLRNPWDQWWSTKISPYFEAVFLSILNAKPRSRLFDIIRHEVGFYENTSPSISALLSFYIENRLEPQSSYKLFFVFWCMTWIEAQSNADLVISIDELSVNKKYRSNTLSSLSKLGVTGVNFDDCKIPHGSYTESDFAFFAPIENSVYSALGQAGFDPFLIEQLKDAVTKERSTVLVKDVSSPQEDNLNQLHRLRKQYLASDSRNTKELRDLRSVNHQHVQAISKYAETQKELIHNLEQAKTNLADNEAGAFSAEISNLKQSVDEMITKASDPSGGKSLTELSQALMGIQNATQSLEAQSQQHEDKTARLQEQISNLASESDAASKTLSDVFLKTTKPIGDGLSGLTKDIAGQQKSSVQSFADIRQQIRKSAETISKQNSTHASSQLSSSKEVGLKLKKIEASVDNVKHLASTAFSKEEMAKAISKSTQGLVKQIEELNKKISKNDQGFLAKMFELEEELASQNRMRLGVQKAQDEFESECASILEDLAKDGLHWKSRSLKQASALSESKNQTEAFKGTIDGLHSTIQGLQSTIEDLSNSSAQTAQTNAQTQHAWTEREALLQAQAHHLEDELQTLRQTVSAMQGSRSWRAMKSLRSPLDWPKGIRGQLRRVSDWGLGQYRNNTKVRRRASKILTAIPFLEKRVRKHYDLEPDNAAQAPSSNPPQTGASVQDNTYPENNRAIIETMLINQMAESRSDFDANRLSELVAQMQDIQKSSRQKVIFLSLENALNNRHR